MEDLVMRIAVFVAVGLGSGFLSGLFGVGGGSFGFRFSFTSCRCSALRMRW